MTEASKQTPMMRQYLRFKADYPDTVLFFHLGDFYETFFEDAELAARELDILLTSRNGHPMAGVPVRRGEAYINQLLKRGHKVAVCQQVEDPKKAKGLVKRDVVRVVTPGTTIEDSVLQDGVNNYLCAVGCSNEGNRHGVAFLDLSTGEFAVTIAEGNEQLRDEIARWGPSEILLSEDASAEATSTLDELLITRVPAATFATDALENSVLSAIEERGLRAAGAVLAYVERTQRGVLKHIRPLESYSLSDHMDLDPFTVTSLELVKPLREGQERGTVLHVLDRTGTSMGRRRLRRMILAPLTDRAAIDERLDAVERLVDASRGRQELRERIGAVHDIERLIGKLGAGRMRPIDLLLLLKSLEPIVAIAGRVADLESGRSAVRLAAIAEALSDPELEALTRELSGMLVDQPPPEARDGGAIRSGYNSELDALRQETKSIRAHLTKMEQEEREKTGIPSLKVGFNRVFGYYLEVTRTHLDKVPEAYHRRQTLANAERFVTAELKEFEERISSGEERAKALELELFEQALERLSRAIPHLQRLADAIAELDVLLALAENAHRYGYVRPAFTEKHEICIRGGRHPVVERIEEFVPNDLDLEEGRDLVILTGPNMAGKSVYLRQTALICLLAQIGSFVPASEAILPIVDRVFARVGASDMLSAGISTFMMEMLEVATILQRATSRSLIILDEMGRGTSTFDGVSIAWAVAKELASRVRAKTLFATHYQELTRLVDEVPNAVNLHIVVKEVGREVVFLHRVEPGTAAGSYGVHVARLAGLPDRVTEVADRILAELLAEAPLSQLGGQVVAEESLPLFGADDHPIIAELRKLDPERITPLEALQILADLQSRLD
jgi:DNA mismatch repair protein MutS